MLDHGVGVGIGTDGGASADHQNMFEAMRMAAFVSRVMTPEPEQWLGSWEVLEMGTAGSARVLGLGDRVGRVEPGFKADLVFVDLGNVNFVPFNDAANQVVNCEDGSAVHSVMIGGRMVLSGRRFTAFDFDALRARVAGTVARLREANAESFERAQAMAEFVSRHCVGLCREEYPARRRIDE